MNFFQRFFFLFKVQVFSHKYKRYVSHRFMRWLFVVASFILMCFKFLDLVHQKEGLISLPICFVLWLLTFVALQQMRVRNHNKIFHPLPIVRHDRASNSILSLFPFRVRPLRLLAYPLISFLLLSNLSPDLLHSLAPSSQVSKPNLGLPLHLNPHDPPPYSVIDPAPEPPAYSLPDDFEVFDKPDDLTPQNFSNLSDRDLEMVNQQILCEAAHVEEDDVKQYVHRMTHATRTGKFIEELFFSGWLWLVCDALAAFLDPMVVPIAPYIAAVLGGLAIGSLVCLWLVEYRLARHYFASITHLLDNTEFNPEHVYRQLQYVGDLRRSRNPAVRCAWMTLQGLFLTCLYFFLLGIIVLAMRGTPSGAGLDHISTVLKHITVVNSIILIVGGFFSTVFFGALYVFFFVLEEMKPLFDACVEHASLKSVKKDLVVTLNKSSGHQPLNYSASNYRRVERGLVAAFKRIGGYLFGITLCVLISYALHEDFIMTKPLWILAPCAIILLPFVIFLLLVASQSDNVSRNLRNVTLLLSCIFIILGVAVSIIGIIIIFKASSAVGVVCVFVGLTMLSFGAVIFIFSVVMMNQDEYVTDTACSSTRLDVYNALGRHMPHLDFPGLFQSHPVTYSHRVTSAFEFFVYKSVIAFAGIWFGLIYRCITNGYMDDAYIWGTFVFLTVIVTAAFAFVHYYVNRRGNEGIRTYDFLEFIFASLVFCDGERPFQYGFHVSFSNVTLIIAFTAFVLFTYLDPIVLSVLIVIPIVVFIIVVVVPNASAISSFIFRKKKVKESYYQADTKDKAVFKVRPLYRKCFTVALICILLLFFVTALVSPFKGAEYEGFLRFIVYILLVIGVLSSLISGVVFLWHLSHAIQKKSHSTKHMALLFYLSLLSVLFSILDLTSLNLGYAALICWFIILLCVVSFYSVAYWAFPIRGFGYKDYRIPETGPLFLAKRAFRSPTTLSKRVYSTLDGLRGPEEYSRDLCSYYAHDEKKVETKNNDMTDGERDTPVEEAMRDGLEGFERSGVYLTSPPPQSLSSRGSYSSKSSPLHQSVEGGLVRSNSFDCTTGRATLQRVRSIPEAGKRSTYSSMPRHEFLARSLRHEPLARSSMHESLARSSRHESLARSLRHGPLAHQWKGYPGSRRHSFASEGFELPRRAVFTVEEAAEERSDSSGESDDEPEFDDVFDANEFDGGVLKNSNREELIIDGVPDARFSLFLREILYEGVVLGDTVEDYPEFISVLDDRSVHAAKYRSFTIESFSYDVYKACHSEGTRETRILNFQSLETEEYWTDSVRDFVRNFSLYYNNVGLESSELQPVLIEYFLKSLSMKTGYNYYLIMDEDYAPNDASNSRIDLIKQRICLNDESITNREFFLTEEEREHLGPRLNIRYISIPISYNQVEDWKKKVLTSLRDSGVGVKKNPIDLVVFNPVEPKHLKQDAVLSTSQTSSFIEELKQLCRDNGVGFIVTLPNSEKGHEHRFHHERDSSRARQLEHRLRPEDATSYASQMVYVPPSHPKLVGMNSTRALSSKQVLDTVFEFRESEKKVHFVTMSLKQVHDDAFLDDANSKVLSQVLNKNAEDETILFVPTFFNSAVKYREGHAFDDDSRKAYLEGIQSFVSFYNFSLLHLPSFGLGSFPLPIPAFVLNDQARQVQHIPMGDVCRGEITHRGESLQVDRSKPGQGQSQYLDSLDDSLSRKVVMEIFSSLFRKQCVDLTHCGYSVSEKVPFIHSEASGGAFTRVPVFMIDTSSIASALLLEILLNPKHAPGIIKVNDELATHHGSRRGCILNALNSAHFVLCEPKYARNPKLEKYIKKLMNVIESGYNKGFNCKISKSNYHSWSHGESRSFVYIDSTVTSSFIGTGGGFKTHMEHIFQNYTERQLWGIFATMMDSKEEKFLEEDRYLAALSHLPFWQRWKICNKHKDNVKSMMESTPEMLVMQMQDNMFDFFRGIYVANISSDDGPLTKESKRSHRSIDNALKDPQKMGDLYIRCMPLMAKWLYVLTKETQFQTLYQDLESGNHGYRYDFDAYVTSVRATYYLKVLFRMTLLRFIAIDNPLVEGEDIFMTVHESLTEHLKQTFYHFNHSEAREKLLARCA